MIGQKVGAAHRSDVFFQGFFHAISDAEAFILIWTPKGGREV